MDNILLVNDIYGLPNDYKVDLVEYKGFKINRGMEQDLIDLMYNIDKSLGYNNLILKSAYRSNEEQKELFKTRERHFRESGVKNSYKRTISRVAFPGYSEHQTGLAVDIISEDAKDYESFGETKSGKWLKENSWKHGFILRYPNGKSVITRTDYEPWHFTYVGKPFAYYFYTMDKTIDEIHLDLHYKGEIQFGFNNKKYILSIIRPEEQPEDDNELILKGTELYNIKVVVKDI